jgi:hypothetical protein
MRAAIAGQPPLRHERLSPMYPVGRALLKVELATRSPRDAP